MTQSYLRNRYYSPNIGRFITEDPIWDRLNWYAYADSNPVLFVDPWGLAPGDITNDSYMQLGKEQQAGVKAAMRARDRGYISREYAAHIAVSLGGEVERLPGIEVEECGGTIRITAHISIDNKISEKKSVYSAEAYEAAAVAGIAEQWSGNYKNRNIRTNVVIEENDLVYDTVHITMINDNAPSKGDMFGENNNITLYPANGSVLYTPEQFKIVAAHEFGHAVFKIIDIDSYDNMTYRYTVTALMNSVSHSGRLKIDYDLMSKNKLFKGTSIYSIRNWDDILKSYVIN